MPYLLCDNMIPLLSYLLLFITLQSPLKVFVDGYLYANEGGGDDEGGTESGLVNMPVIDYILPKSNSHLYDPQETEEEYEYRVNHPPFLDSKGTSNGPRVVEFYATWCGHCQHYKHKYIRLANDVQSNYPQVQFYAIDCPTFPRICDEYDIHSYPTLLWFHSDKIDSERNYEVIHNSGVGLTAKRLIKSYLLVDMEKEIDNGDENDGEKAIQQGGSHDGDTIGNEKEMTNTTDSSLLSSSKSSSSPPDDVVLSSSTMKERSYPESYYIYNDAALSFVYALRTTSYTKMTPQVKSILLEWLTLLQSTLPSSFQTTNTLIDDIQQLIQTLLTEFSTIDGRDDIIQIIDRHQQSEEEENRLWDNTSWSPACSSTPQSGYTCGLWQLFHILTIGVQQQNHQERRGKLLNMNEIFTPSQAADILRNYIEHFFECEECRNNFVQTFDSCAFDRCTKLSNHSKKKKNSRDDDDDINELSIWLWRVHNDVNVRLRQQQEEEEGEDVDVILSWEELYDAQWPSIEACPLCWEGTNDGEDWDPYEVNTYLKNHYWWNGDESMMMMNEAKDIDGGIITSIVSYQIFLVCLFLVCVMCYKRLSMLFSGEHKWLDTLQLE